LIKQTTIETLLHSSHAWFNNYSWNI